MPRIFIGPNLDASKITTIYSASVLSALGEQGDAALETLSQEIPAQLNAAKALMNQAGIQDITKAAAMKVSVGSGQLKVVPGLLNTNGSTPVFSPVSWLENKSVIIASSLDLTNTNLIIQPSVSELNIIVQTLTCGAGAQISYDDSTVWNPSSAPQTTAQSGVSYNPNGTYTNPANGKTSVNGPSGGVGAGGAPGSPQTATPPAAPNVNIYALNITGMPALNLQGLKGARGNPGQNGGKGGNGAAGVNGSDIAVWGVGICTQSPGDGGNGGNGGPGGNGGNGGPGSNGGSVLVATTTTCWSNLVQQSLQISLSNSGGPGGDPGLPGSGGAGGTGGRGGNSSPGGACKNNADQKGANGRTGQQGAPGATGQAGNDGPAGSSSTQTLAAITQDDWNSLLTQPWLVSISPTMGPPGIVLTAAVLNIQAGDTVLVNGQSVSSTSPASGQMQFTLPASLTGSSATISIRRANDGATSNPMTFFLKAFVSSCVPSTGAAPLLGQPGTTVTINGGPFAAGTKVAFGQDTPIAPASFTVGATSFTAVVPPTAASGPLSVTPAPGTAGYGAPNFAVDNYRNTRGLSWVNSNLFQNLFAPYDYADATALFGTNQTYKMLGPVNLDGPWVNLFLTIANALLSGSSGGECFGMSLTSLQFAAGQIPLSNYPQQPAGAEPNGPASPNVWTLDGPELGNGGAKAVTPIATLVHQRHLAQLSQESINNWVTFHINVTSAAQLLSALQEAFTVGGPNGAGAIIALDPSLGEGHAVVACNVVETGNGNFNILLYNPNDPFSPGEDTSPSLRAENAGQSVISVSSDGHWTFNGFSPTWTGDIFNITVIPFNTVPLVPSFPWAEVVAGVLAAAVIVIVVADAAVSQVSDGQGHTLLDNGKWNVNPATMLPGVRPMPNLSGSGKSMAPAFVSNKSGPLTHTITGTGSGTYDLIWMGFDSGTTLSSIPTALNADDTVVLDSGVVTFTPSSAKAICVALLGTSTNSKVPRTGTLKTTASAANAIKLSYDPAADAFTYVHAGSPATYTLEFSTLDAQGNPATLVTTPAPVANGDTRTFTPNWTQLVAGSGTVQVRTAAGAVTTAPLS
jgi:hypothetical protein